MALRNQPYLPLFVQDYLTDEKLNMCSAASQGVYIKIMCLFHKSDPYGGILLKQKDKQGSSTHLNFALKFAKLLPFDLHTIENAITELLEEKVLLIDGDFIYQKRMVKDNDISEKRSLSGSSGGKKTQSKNKKFAKAKNKANTEYESEYENEYENEDKRLNFDFFWDLYGKKVGDKNKCRRTWFKIDPEIRIKIIEILPKWKKQFNDIQFQPYPETFLNQERWNDEIIPNESNREYTKNGFHSPETSATIESISRQFAEVEQARISAETLSDSD